MLSYCSKLFLHDFMESCFQRSKDAFQVSVFFSFLQLHQRRRGVGAAGAAASLQQLQMHKVYFRPFVPINPNQPISQPKPLFQPQTTLLSTTIKLLVISNHNKISPIQQLPFNHNQPTSSTQPTTFSANLPIPQPILLTNISNSTILEATGLVSKKKFLPA